MNVATYDRYSNGYLLCSTSQWFVLHTDETDSLQGLLENKYRKLGKTIIHSFRYIEDVLSLNKSPVGDYLHLVYPNKHEKRDDITSYLDLHLYLPQPWCLHFSMSTSRSSVAIFQQHVVYISDLIRYGSICCQYSGVWTKISYWRNSYSKWTVLRLGWCHGNKNYTVATTTWLNFTQKPISQL